MTVFEAIKLRRSVRKFKDMPIKDEVLNEMLEAARLSPSGGNSQNYVFGVIKDKILKDQLAEAAGNQMWIATAPVIFACCGDISWDIAKMPEDDFGLVVNNLRFGLDFINNMKKYPDRRAFRMLHHNSTPVIAMTFIILTATSHGLSACPVGYLDIDKATKILNLPDHLACLFLLPIGYIDEIPGEKYLKSVDEISFYDKWE